MGKQVKNKKTPKSEVILAANNAMHVLLLNIAAHGT